MILRAETRLLNKLLSAQETLLYELTQTIIVIQQFP